LIIALIALEASTATQWQHYSLPVTVMQDTIAPPILTIPGHKTLVVTVPSVVFVQQAIIAQ
jgi:hypothetical protein